MFHRCFRLADARAVFSRVCGKSEGDETVSDVLNMRTQTGMQKRNTNLYICILQTGHHKHH